MKTYTLNNGIPIVLAPVKGTSVLTALVLFKVGSRHEIPSNNGVSHFVEHLFFKGTTHRPTTLDISRELDGVGADFNAFTSKDYTGYYVKVSAQHARLAVDILEDILFHPLFDEKEIDRERGVIVEEINMYEDNPMATAEELSEQLLFGARHPLGYRIAGPKKNILHISREDIIAYRDLHYHSKNMVIVISGSIASNMRQMIDEKFSRSPKPTKRTPPYKKFVYTQRHPRLQVLSKKTAQSHLALSFPGPTYTSKDFAAAQVLSTVLGGNMSSRLFIQVRERQGLCYYIRSGISPYEDMGAFTIQAGFDTKRIHQAITGIISQLQQFRDAKKAQFSQEELQKAKEYIAGKLNLRFEDSEEVASWWGRQALFKKTWGTIDDFEKQVRAVTQSDVLTVAAKTFTAKHANLVVIGPYSQNQQVSFQKHLRF